MVGSVCGLDWLLIFRLCIFNAGTCVYNYDYMSAKSLEKVVLEVWGRHRS